MATATKPKASKKAPTPTPTLPVHLVVVLDRSGSMVSICDATIEGMNAFMDEQRKIPDGLTVTVQTFDTGPFEYIATAKPIADVPKFSHDNYVPRGGTPLYDAIGTEIENAEKHLETLPDPKPSVLFVIMTDGLENASRKYTREQIFEIVNKKQADHGWRFIFLGANQDSYSTGAVMGMHGTNTSNYSQTVAGTRSVLDGAAFAVSNYRSMSATARLDMAEDLFKGNRPDDVSQAGAPRQPAVLHPAGPVTPEAKEKAKLTRSESTPDWLSRKP